MTWRLSGRCSSNKAASTMIYRAFTMLHKYCIAVAKSILMNKLPDIIVFTAVAKELLRLSVASTLKNAGLSNIGTVIFLN